MKRQLTITAVAVLVIIGMATTATAQSEDTEVSVDVDDTVALDVKPDQLDYTEVGSGDGDALLPGEQVEQSDQGFEHVEIENIGSDRLDKIYAESDLHDEDPFGTVSGSSAEHNTGNLVLMSTETVLNDDDYRDDLQTGVADVNDPVYLNRIEYFEDTPPEYIQTLSTDDDANMEIDVGEGTSAGGEVNEVDVARFRTGELSYITVFVETADEELFLVGNTPETPTDLGTFDFTNDNEDEFTVIGLDTGEGDGEISAYTGGFALANFDADSYESDDPVLDGNSDLVDFGQHPSLDDADVEERNYNLFLDRTDNNELVARVSLNTNFETPNGQGTDVDSTGGQQFILDADGTEDESLQPGENFPVNFGVQLPNGIDNQNIQQGTVTLSAEAFTTS